MDRESRAMTVSKRVHPSSNSNTRSDEDEAAKKSVGEKVVSEMWRLVSE